MTTVALAGGDGAGKTTIARLLETSLPWPVKYLYMGSSIISSNAALPTSRLARALKMRAYRKASGSIQDVRHEGPSPHDLYYGTARRGTIWVVARFLNRLAEAWWRQLLSFIYQVRGYVVICDRHVLFEAEDRTNTKVNYLFDHLEHWILYHSYPRPDAVIFLDAPAEVLYSRKGESTLDHLREQRETILKIGKSMRNFVVIDASRPLDIVFEEVMQQVIAFHISGDAKQMRKGV